MVLYVTRLAAYSLHGLEGFFFVVFIAADYWIRHLSTSGWTSHITYNLPLEYNYKGTDTSGYISRIRLGRGLIQQDLS